MNIVLQNPDVVKTTLEEVGKFASICKSAEPPKSSDTLRKIGLACLNSGHFSPSRHIYWWFSVEGISRVCTHQLVRHSVGVAINQASGVFQGVDNDPSKFVVPNKVSEILDEDEVLRARYFHLINEALDINEKLVEKGASNSDARYIIPMSQMSALNFALTPEALIHVAHERLCNHAQWEIRSVIKACCDQVIAIEPAFRKLLVPKCFYLNRCNEAKSCGMYDHVAKMKESVEKNKDKE